MRSLLAAAAVLALLLTLPGAGPAQPPPPKIRIDQGGVRVGFPTIGEALGASGYKVGAWTPVYVQLTAGNTPFVRGEGDLVIETTDSDDMQNTYTVELPPMEANEQTTVMTYTRTGSTGSEVTARIRGHDGRILWSDKANKSNSSPGGPGAFVYLTAGSSVARIKTGLRPTVPPDQAVNNNPTADDLLVFAFVSLEKELPTRWFGYAGVDVLLLNTGSEQFTRELLEDKNNRKEALAEWVRRGGHLVLSVGTQHQLVKSLLEKMPLIPCTIAGTVKRRQLRKVAKWAGVNEDNPIVGPVHKDKAEKADAPEKSHDDLDLVKFEIEPGRGVQELVIEPPDDNDPKSRPVIVQAPCGLGRVILVAFDLDQPPFTDWSGQKAFWQKLDSELRKNTVQNDKNINNGFGGGFNSNGVPTGWEENEVGNLLQDRLEAFDEVPVISFGWVALFIIIYIVVVGPLDYLILKKVVKRLELTWITFPAVVLAVSAIAYVSAYYLKGNDLRINKVDVVDVIAERGAEADPGDARSQATRAYGTTWFTLFSPRIQNYTIGVDPAPGSWVPELEGAQAGRNPHSVVVSWMGRAQNNWGGGPGGSPSLFRRAYDYAPDASGLEGVPIQVWSSKTFTASWQAGLSETQPLFRADLRRGHEKGAPLTGTLTSQLPVDLQDVVLFYHTHKVELGTLKSGQTVTLDTYHLSETGGGHPGGQPADWLQNVQASLPAQQNPYGYNPRYQSSGPKQSADGIVKLLLFGDLGHNLPPNNTFRDLDQSWRLEQATEVILVGRTERKDSGAEKVSQDGVSPTRLWLGQLPSSGEPRRALAGKLSQETYARVFLPVLTKE